MTAQISHLRPGEELIDAETFAAIHSRHPAALAPPAGPGRISLREVVRKPPRRPSAPISTRRSSLEQPSASAPCAPSSPAAAAALEAEIDGCTSREHVARLALHLAHAYSPAAALFQVHRGTIERVCAHGRATRSDALQFPADASSLFASVIEDGQPFRGAPPRTGIEDRILRALDRRHVQEVALLPIEIRGRVVSLLLVDNGPEALGETSLAALTAVCARVSGAYERLILERKASEATS